MVEEVRARPGATADFSAPMAAQVAGLKAFLFASVYRHPEVTHPMNVAKRIVADLFAAFTGDLSLLPPSWEAEGRQRGEEGRVSVVRDYIAGMTDRFALQEHRRIFDVETEL
jgi:dGTPase